MPGGNNALVAEIPLFNTLMPVGNKKVTHT